MRSRRPTAGEIEGNLSPLTGLNLSIARRAADMRVFHFGEVRAVDGGTVGQFALHVQCPWRIDGPEGIVTGRTDLWTLPSGEFPPDDWSYDDGNLQDERITTLLRGDDPSTRSHVNETRTLVVEEVWASEFGDVVLSLSGGYRIAIFPVGSDGEAWRVFRPGDSDSHFVLSEQNVSMPRSDA